MVEYYESIYYDTLEELQATHKPDNPDRIKLQKKYGEDVQFGTAMYPLGIKPRFELRCYKILA